MLKNSGLSWLERYQARLHRVYTDKEKKLYGVVTRKWRSCSGHHCSTVFRAYFKGSPCKRLAANFKRSAGRTLGGTTTVYTKCHAKKRSVLQFSRGFSFFSGFVMLLHLRRDPRSVKLAALCVNSSGELQYVPCTQRAAAFRLFFGANLMQINSSVEMSIFLLKHRYSECVSLLKYYQVISYVAASPEKRITMAKAPGSQAGVLVRKKKQSPRFQGIQLPSGKFKVIDVATIVLLGAVLPKKKKLHLNTRAGYWRNLGHKPTVRGIVKNPVDHPHGGEARTILWPRSPWGKSTK